MVILYTTGHFPKVTGYRGLIVKHSFMQPITFSSYIHHLPLIALHNIFKSKKPSIPSCDACRCMYKQLITVNSMEIKKQKTSDDKKKGD